MSAAGIEVWRIELGGDPAWAPDVLTDRERARADAYSSAGARRRWLIARAAMRTVLGRTTGTPPGSVDISFGPHGKPRTPGVEFNLTDSGDLALLAVSDRPVGVDLERIRPDRPLDRLASRVMSEAELQAYERSDDRVLAFYRTWTRKEALAKAIGRGIGIGLRRVDVSSNTPSLDGVSQPGWWMTPVDTDPGHVASLCAGQPPIGIVHRRFEAP